MSLKTVRTVVVALGLMLIGVSTSFADRPRVGDGSVFAEIPTIPGFPEEIAIHGDLVYVTTQARFGTAGSGPSHVLVYHRKTAELLHTIVLEGEDLTQEHGMSGVTTDVYGRAYVISTQLGVLRLSKQGKGYLQEPWGNPNPDRAFPSLPNGMVFDADGNLFITDSLQGRIVKIGPQGGNAKVWFQSDPTRDDNLFVTGMQQVGPNGIKFSPQRKYLYFAYTGGPALPRMPPSPGPEETPQEGRIYRLPAGNPPAQDSLERVFTYPLSDSSVFGPDGVTFDKFGRLWVSMVSDNAISVVRFGNPDRKHVIGREVNRLTGPPGSQIAYDTPSALAFDGRNILVVNHAAFSAVNPTRNPFALLKVFAGVRGDRLEHPVIRDRP